MVASRSDDPRPAADAGSSVTPAAIAARRQLEGFERHQRSRVLFVTGPGGSGKSWALDEIGRIGDDRHWLTGYSSVVDISVRDAVAMTLIRAVRHLFERQPGSPAIAPLARVVATLSGDLVDLLPVPAEPMRHTGSFADDLRLCLRRLTSVANDISHAGMLIRLDDAHAADPADLDQLTTVAAESAVQSVPVAFVIAGLGTIVGLGRSLPPDSIEVVRMVPLDLRASAVMVQEMTAHRRVRFEPEALAVFGKAAGGNPLLLEFMAHGVIAEQDRLDPSHISAKHAQSIARAAYSSYERAVLLPGYTELDEPTQRFLRALASFDGPASIERVIELIEASVAGSRREAITAVLGGLLQSGWVYTEDFSTVDFAYPRTRHFVSALAN
ncbi:MAG: AAA family ATPase [Acidimicrobiia bacterium]